MGGGEDPEPADRGGHPRRLDPQVPRRHRGFYVGGPDRDDGGYFDDLTPEQDYGAAGGDDRDLFAPAPEQVYVCAGSVVAEDLGALAEGIPFFVRRPGGSPGRLPFARGRAPPPLLTNALGANDGKTGGHQHGEVHALGASDLGEREGTAGHGQQHGAIRQLPLGAAGHGQQQGANRQPPLGAAGHDQQHGANHRPHVENALGAHDSKTEGHQHGEVHALGAADLGEKVGAAGHGQQHGAIRQLPHGAAGQGQQHGTDDCKAGGHQHGEVHVLGAADIGERVGAAGHDQLPLGAAGHGQQQGANHQLPPGAAGHAQQHGANRQLAPGAAGHAQQQGANYQLPPRAAGHAQQHGANHQLPPRAAGHVQQHGANHRPRVEAEPRLNVDLRANRNHPDRYGRQPINLEKKHKTNNEFANNKNEDLMDLVASLERLKNDIDDAKKENNRYAAKKLSKYYEGALAKALRYQREIRRAGGVPRPIPAKLLLLPH